MAEACSDLVIGIGNPLRGDDGVGWWLARRAETLKLTPRVLRVQQLTPELAEELAGARRVLFIDAWWPRRPWARLAQAPLTPPRSASAPPPIATSGHPQGLLITASVEERNNACQGGRPSGLPAASGALLPPGATAPCLLPLVVAGGGGDTGVFSHQLAPAQLLAITALLYGRTPPAWVLLIPARAMPHSPELSAALQALLPQAEQLLWRWAAAENQEAWSNPDPPAGSGHSHA